MVQASGPASFEGGEMSLHPASFENALFVTFSHPHTASALRTVMRSVDGPVHVLGIVPPAGRLQRLVTPHETSQHVEEALRTSVLDDLEDWVRRASGTSTPDDVTTEVATGHVVSIVLDRIAERAHDLLAVTGHPDDQAARAVIGRLQRKSPVPVWVLRPDRTRKRRILAAVDVDQEHHGLDHRILAAAQWLARPGDEVHVLSAWELVGEATLRSSPFLMTPDEEISRLREECEQRVRAELDELLAAHDFDGADLHVVVRNGSAADAIVDEVERSSINQIVLGTIARHGIPGFVIGNTAEQLLNEVSCSEFVVKPPTP
jgi:universal stress protein E